MKQRIDALSKVIGEAKYAADLKIPGMLVGKILRSTCAHAHICEIDTSKVKEIPGVACVITWEDLPRVPFTPAGIPEEAGPLDMYVLDKKVRYFGEPVAAVAAVDEETAEKALKAISIKYEELEPVFAPIEALRDGAPVVHEDYPDNIGERYTYVTGDVKKAAVAADYVFADSYEIPAIQHMPLEPHICISYFDKGGRMHIFSSTQVPFTLKKMVAKTLALDPADVVVHMPVIGGGFGSKQEIVYEPLCAALTVKTKKPVRLSLSRDEDMSCTRTRHGADLWIRTGVNRDGTIVSREMVMHVNNGAYCSHGYWIPSVAGMHWAHQYRCENISFVGDLVYTNMPTGGAFRGYGCPQAFFANESHFDRIASELGFDPVEFRLMNVTDTVDADPVFNWDMKKNSTIKQCLKDGAQKFGWYEKKNTPSDQNKAIGYGMSCFVYLISCNGNEDVDTTSVIMYLREDGHVTISVGSVEIGQGCHTVFADIASAVLGIPREMITIAPIDTDTSPYDAGTFATRQTYMGGKAIELAAKDLRKQLDQYAADCLGGKSEDVQIDNGTYYLKDQPEKTVTVKELAWESVYGKRRTFICSHATWDGLGSTPAYGAHFAEVEVDKETGNVNVKRVLVVHDVGKVLNRTALEGQLDGGVVMGIGSALSEELIFNGETGEILNDDFRNYRLSSALSGTDIEYLFLENPSEHGPLGARGIGEPSFIPATTAITNAICDAIGTRIDSLPFTAEKIVTAIENKAHEEV